VNYVGNDLNLPNFIREKQDYFALDQSFMVSYFRKTLNQVKMIRRPEESEGGILESEPQKVPKQYRKMVGLEAYKAAMKELQALSRNNNFEVVVLSHKSLRKFAKKISKDLGFHVVNTAPLWKRYASEKNLNASTAWQLNEDDPHPSAVGHKIIAEALFEFLKEERLVCPAHRRTSRDAP
jgi:hypothetical protein